MADGFEEMVDAAQLFFRDLAVNNEKTWFEPRKDHYIQNIRTPAELFADLAAEDFARLTAQPQAPKVFRIYRDVRFSKDKSPYKPHLHILWSAGQPTAPTLFFAIDPNRLWFGLGLPGLSGEMLTRYRRLVDTHGDTLSEQLDDLAQSHSASLSDFGAEPLKRVPKPYDADHPHGDLLRRKGLVLGSELDPAWRDQGLLKALRGIAGAYLPLWQLIHTRL